MYANKPLDLFGTLFRFQGRIGRLAFVGYSLLIGFSLVALFFIAFSMMEKNVASVQLGGLAVLFLPGVLAIWPGAALMSKRLHDFDRSAVHGVWIGALWYLSPWLPDPFSTVFGFGGVIAALGLIFIPGSAGPNRYGHKAGMVRMSGPVVGTYRRK